MSIYLLPFNFLHIYLSLLLLTFFFKTRYPIQGPTNLRGPIPPLTWRPEGIKRETLSEAHSKISSQRLGQPQINFNFILI